VKALTFHHGIVRTSPNFATRTTYKSCISRIILILELVKLVKLHWFCVVVPSCWQLTGKPISFGPSTETGKVVGGKLEIVDCAEPSFQRQCLQSQVLASTVVA
jgi:hypothetical protein